jgi:hypothetical protein
MRDEDRGTDARETRADHGHVFVELQFFALGVVVRRRTGGSGARVRF